MGLPSFLLLLLYVFAAVVAAAPCSKPSKADIVWFVDSTALAPNELQAVAGLIQAVVEDLAPDGGVRMGYVDAAAAPRLKVGLASVVDHGMRTAFRDAAASLHAMGSEFFAQIPRRAGSTRILILFSPDARIEAAARSLKNDQDVLLLLLHVGRVMPSPDFADFVIHAADFDELATTKFRSSFLCLDKVPHSNSVQSARSLVMTPAANRRLAAGSYHFNYMQDNGEVYSWGYYQGLGANISSNSASPVQMLGVSHATGVSAGNFHTCVVDDGAAKCCGQGTYGQLGNNATDTILTVVQVQGLSANVSQVVAGGFHACAILETGGMQCWGRNTYGQLGNEANADSSVSMSVIGYESSGVHSACGGGTHTCIVTTAGAALCAGYGTLSQLGNGGTAHQNTMIPVTNLTSGVTQMSCGNYHTCALLSTGVLACFGNNGNGQLGMGTPSLTK